MMEEEAEIEMMEEEEYEMDIGHPEDENASGADVIALPRPKIFQQNLSTSLLHWLTLHLVNLVPVQKILFKSKKHFQCRRQQSNQGNLLCSFPHVFLLFLHSNNFVTLKQFVLANINITCNFKQNFLQLPNLLSSCSDVQVFIHKPKIK
eukprot:TRINITY_DN1039_c0_g1_i1.p2 TRINITY_DN1039_c0_g1~~TRINITY_DN1039_c0_g1_i1.p2  ORF type:complete len:149 (-),score=0.34 TRINITY_DN1039_c0_g1_i1:29-475(-)